MKYLTGIVTLLALIPVLPNALAQHHIIRRALHPLHHTTHHANRGGHYVGGHGSSHKGGHYVNARKGNHYRKHK